MKKEQFYALIIVVLLLLNLGTLGYLWKSANNMIAQDQPEQQRPGAYIVKSLQLDEQQEKDFHVLGRSHKRQLDSVHMIMKDAQVRMFELVGKGTFNEAEKDSLLQVIKQAEGAKQLIIATHFSDVRKILKPNQLPLFEHLMIEIGNNVGRPANNEGEGRGHRPPPPRP